MEFTVYATFLFCMAAFAMCGMEYLIEHNETAGRAFERLAEKLGVDLNAELEE